MMRTTCHAHKFMMGISNGQLANRTKEVLRALVMDREMHLKWPFLIVVAEPSRSNRLTISL